MSAFELQAYFNTSVETVEIKKLLGQGDEERREGIGICAQNWTEMTQHLVWIFGFVFILFPHSNVALDLGCYHWNPTWYLCGLWPSVWPLLNLENNSLFTVQCIIQQIPPLPQWAGPLLGSRGLKGSGWSSFACVQMTSS